MRWSDIITDKQDPGQVDNTAAMMGISYEKEIDAIQKMDTAYTKTGSPGFHGHSPNVGKSTGDASGSSTGFAANR